GFAFGGHVGNVGSGLFGKIGRQLALHAALEFGSQPGELGTIGLELLLPVGLNPGALLFSIPLGVDSGRYLEWCIGPVQLLAHHFDLVGTQRRTVAAGLAAMLGRTEADGGLAA